MFKSKKNIISVKPKKYHEITTRPMIKLLTAAVMSVTMASSVYAAEDSYHIELRNQLNSEYGLSGGSWVLGDNEVDKAAGWSGNGLTSTAAIADQAFTQVINLENPEAQQFSWDVSVRINAQEDVNENDVLLAVFWTRKVSAEGASGVAEVLYEKNSDPWTKSLIDPIDMGDEWTQVLIPFQGAILHSVGEAHFGFNLGLKAQSLQLGGVAILNYGDTIELSALKSKVIETAEEDSYHTELRNQLNSQYGLSGGTWVLGGNEVDKAKRWNGNGLTSTAEIADQAFTQVLNIASPETQNFSWDVSVRIDAQENVGAGDVMLAVFWTRKESAEGEVGIADVLYEKNSDPWTKSLLTSLDLNDEWTQVLIPFQGAILHPIGETHFGFNLGHQAQNLQIGGAAILNYGDSIEFSDLSDLVVKYDGREADAPWRSEAKTRIDQYRKTNVTVTVKDRNGYILPNANVEVDMESHDFAFGTAVSVNEIADNSTFREHILNVDGKGHGFNATVIENGLKWGLWEIPSWNVNTLSAIPWLKDNGLRVRGHNVIWPGFQWMPSDIQTNQGDLSYLDQRINDRIDDVMSAPGIIGELFEWDVINETISNTDIADAFAGSPGYITGEEKYAEWFLRAEAIDPSAKLFVNDFGILGGGGLDVIKQQAYRDYIENLIAANANVGGIGLQGHMHASLTPPQRVYDIIDDYAIYNKDIVITEYDAGGLEGQLDADYTRDMLTATFSHSSVTGFYMWGFWDGNHWLSDSTLFDNEWNLKSSGQAYVDLVFGEWWTDEDGSTDAEGQYAASVFKGEHTIKVEFDGHEATVQANLTDNNNVTVVLEDVGSPLNCSHEVVTLWNVGFVSHVDITNTSDESASSWRVCWEYTNGASRNGGWNADTTGDSHYCATNLSWNGDLSPGESTTFGITGDTNPSGDSPEISITSCEPLE